MLVRAGKGNHVNVREAIAVLSQFDGDLAIEDEYGETALSSFYESTYDDDTGTHKFVVYETTETE